MPALRQAVSAPSAWSSGWRCQWHGVVVPAVPAYRPGAGRAEGAAARRRDAGLGAVAAAGWLAGDGLRSAPGTTGRDAAHVWSPLSGPNPMGGLGEMLLVSEEMGWASAPGWRACPGPIPRGLRDQAPHAFVRYGHHDFPLWHVDAPDRAALRRGDGRELAVVVLWPDTAGVLLVETLPLRDLRDPGQNLDLPFGAASYRRLPG